MIIVVLKRWFIDLKKVVQGKNYNVADKTLSISLVAQYKNFIQYKKTDGDKLQKTWGTICDGYNSHVVTKRSKKQFENL